jgi:hypothetical protein
MVAEVQAAPTSWVWLNSWRPVTASKRCAVTRAARVPAAAPSKGVPAARNSVLGFRYFSFRLRSPSTCAHMLAHAYNLALQTPSSSKLAPVQA